jgi:amino acid adenylation domain-containing protein
VDSLAYVIYTSGSTGRPKGVLIPHSHPVDLFAATEPWFEPRAEDVWTLFHSFAFDFSVWELWGALLYGGRLVVVPYEVSRSPEAFLRLLRVQRVTMLSQTPSAFQALVREETGSPRRKSGTEEPADHAALALRAVVFGGEALEARSLAPWIERHGDEAPRLINMYGITETTVHVTYRRLRREDVLGKTDPGIGEAIPDQSLRILEPDFFAAGEPSPIGVPGELCVGGGRLARGYLGRPALTAQRFVPDPTSGVLGARLYRSGDRGRYRADGSVEYLGRIDQQLKLRGFRIEAGEVEAALMEHPSVSAAVVMVRAEDGSSEAGSLEGGGDARLVAYLVVPEAAPPEVESQARELAREQLPEYMVPAAYVRLAQLPLTANGKVDRKRLPAPGARAVVRGEVVPPKGPVEETIAAIWGEVLGISEVGAEDTFFDLGGHSLLMVQVHEKLRQAFPQAITMLDLFRHPTVTSLATFLEQAAGVSGGAAPEPAPVGQGYSRAEQRKRSVRRRGRRGGTSGEQDG